MGKLLLWPHSSLKTVCVPVDLSNDKDYLNQLLEMKEIMVAAGGLGLAANQIGLNKRLLVAHAQGRVHYFVNPRIVGFSGTWDFKKEGCLSLPGISVDHKRNSEVIVESVDLQTGSTIVSPYNGRLAHILQHEIDHLDGKTMVDRLPGGQKDRIRNHMKLMRKVKQ